MTTTTADGWLSEILRDPASDFFRLAWADEVEARDGPGDAERAEFVRVQVELARLEGVSVRPLLESARTRAVILDAVLEYQRDGLRRRERELLQAHYPDWLPRLIPGEQVIGGPDDTGRCIVVPFDGVWFRRGFVEEVACPLEAWTGGACRQCMGHGSYRTTVGGTGPIHPPCDHCHGTGRVAGVGASLVRAAPLLTVRVTDREPFGRYTAWSWWDASRPHPSDEHPKSELPAEVFALLRGGRGDARTRLYDSEAAALADLSDLSAVLIRLAKGGDA